MFCDIRGFSKIAEDFPPDVLIGLLNEHFEAITDTLLEHEGALDKFFGDEFMAVFCSVASTEGDALRCVRAALMMQKRNRDLNVCRSKKNLPAFSLGMGINTGAAIAGYVGSPILRELTIVGDTVNTARRLCSIAMPGQILAGDATYGLLAARVRAKSMGAVAVPGKSRVVRPYEILSVLEEKMLTCG
jgi:adenylate cyclase